MNPRWYSWNAKKIIWDHLGIRLGPRAGCPRGFKLFNFRTSWNHLRFKIYCQNIRETTKIFKKINETRSQKKMRSFFLKPFGFHQLWIICNMKPLLVSQKLTGFHFTQGNPILMIKTGTFEKCWQHPSTILRRVCFSTIS